jgi:hypothetical protein
MGSKAFTTLAIILFIVALLVAGGDWYYAIPHSVSSSIPPASQSSDQSDASSSAITTAPAELAPAETASTEPTNTSLSSYKWSTIHGSSTETYFDPNNAFSIQYLNGFSVVPSDEYNGLGYQSRFCASQWSKCSNSNQLSELLIGIQPDGFEVPDPAVNTYLSYITIAYGTSTTEMACDQPGDSSTTIMHYDEDGIKWSLGRSPGIHAPGGLQGLSDQFQTYNAGACWGAEFDWVSSDDRPILRFEEAVMSTFQFLNKNAQPYYVPYNPED